METPSVAPVLMELIKTLPPPGARWPTEQRVYWLDAARNILRLIYPDPLAAQGEDERVAP